MARRPKSFFTLDTIFASLALKMSVFIWLFSLELTILTILWYCHPDHLACIKVKFYKWALYCIFVKAILITVLPNQGKVEKKCPFSGITKIYLSLFTGCHLTENRPGRSSSLKVFFENGVLKIYSKFTGEQPCQSANFLKLQSNFIKITLWHGCYLLYIVRIPFFRTPLESFQSDQNYCS